MTRTLLAVCLVLPLVSCAAPAEPPVTKAAVPA
jgi:hypothetical protein